MLTVSGFTPRSVTALALLLTLWACEDTPTNPEVVPIESSSMTTDHFPGQVKVIDARGDNTGPIDIQGMVLSFDPSTGDYQIQLRAYAHAPFDGDFRVNIHLFNETAGSLFSDALHDYALTAGQQELVLTGTNPALTGWSMGDVVHTNSLHGQPNPPGSTLFRSQVTSVPFGFLTNEDVIEPWPAGTPAIVTGR